MPPPKGSRARFTPMTVPAMPSTNSAVRAPVEPSFQRWTAATSAPEELSLGLLGFTYADLYLPAKLAELTAAFHRFLGERDAAALDGLKQLEAHAGAMPDPIAT